MQKENITGEAQKFLDSSKLYHTSCPLVPGTASSMLSVCGADAEADMQLLENSVSISGLKADDFDAIYVPGGHGIAGSHEFANMHTPMVLQELTPAVPQQSLNVLHVAVDGPNDATLHKLISDFAAQGKLVSAVCHGPVAFSGPTVNGKPLVAGKKVSLTGTGKSNVCVLRFCNVRH